MKLFFWNTSLFAYIVKWDVSQEELSLQPVLFLVFHTLDPSQ